MTKEEADKELHDIEKKLIEIEAERFGLSKKEYHLCVRKHALMLQFYPNILQDKINKVLALRRQYREDNGSD